MVKRSKKKEFTSGVCPECKIREGDSSTKKLFKCEYCGGYFCEKHLPPRLTVPRETIERIKDPVLRNKAYNDWRKANAHPDFVWSKKYFEELKVKEEKVQREIYFKHKIKKLSKIFGKIIGVFILSIIVWMFISFCYPLSASFLNSFSEKIEDLSGISWFINKTVEVENFVWDTGGWVIDIFINKTAEFERGPEERTLTYVLRGKKGE